MMISKVFSGNGSSPSKTSAFFISTLAPYLSAFAFAKRSASSAFSPKRGSDLFSERVPQPSTSRISQAKMREETRVVLARVEIRWAPVSREGAFLANNVLFSLFAFVILLGTVFPLIVEAKDDRKIAVGSPLFDTMAQPIGLVLLFLMAVAPALPWRKASAELLRDRLFWPAWCGVATLAFAVAVGATGFAPLLAFGLAGFAAGSALRQLVLATRRQGYRGLLGRTNGGMIVHLGIILIAVALAASNSYTRSGEFTVAKGETIEFAGHTFTLVDLTDFTTARAVGIKAEISIDGGQAYAPAISKFIANGMDVATPSVKTGFTKDIYLTLENGSKPSTGVAKIKIFIKPMIVWLWIGGVLCAVGTVLAAFPGRHRRRPTDAVSAGIDLTDAPVASPKEVADV